MVNATRRRACASVTQGTQEQIAATLTRPALATALTRGDAHVASVNVRPGTVGGIAASCVQIDAPAMANV